MNVLKYWFPPIVWLIGIYLLSSSPSLSIGLPTTLDSLARIAGHVLVYFVLTFLLIRAFDQGGRQNRPRLFLAAAVIATIVSFADEFRQAFVPGRHADGMDILIDGIGIDAAVFFVRKRWNN